MDKQPATFGAIDEEALETAFLNFDGERHTTWLTERDAFKRAVRGLLRSHLTQALIDDLLHDIPRHNR